MTSVTLITRAGCHLCGPAREVVHQVCQRLTVVWCEKSVDSDPGWQLRFSSLIPVVLVDGRMQAYWRVEEELLQRALEQSLRHASVTNFHQAGKG